MKTLLVGDMRVRETLQNCSNFLSHSVPTLQVHFLSLSYIVFYSARIKVSAESLIK